MGDLAVTLRQFVEAPPEAVFGRFGEGSGAGWLFDAACDRLRVGAAVTLRVPLAGSGVVDLIGRISAVRYARSITITHDQPWRGRLHLRFAQQDHGTEVRLVVEIDERGLEWLMRRQGLPVPPTTPSGTRVGLLTSKSGPGSLFAEATENLATLAVVDINGQGGLAGGAVELVVADDATDPATGVLEAARLVRAGCRTLFVMTTSATYEAASRALAGTEVLVVQPLMNEGGGEDRLRVRLGERPAALLAAAAGPLMKAAEGRRWFLAGNNYVWPRRMNEAAHALLPGFGATIVEERYAPLGTTDFTPIINAIAAKGTDIVLSTFVGADAAAFERQCHAMGLRERTMNLAPGMDEATLERIGAAAGAGIRGVSGYFQGLDTELNNALLARYRKVFGLWAAPLSSLSESVYEAILLWAAAVRRAGSVEPVPVGRQMRTGSYELPRGTVSFDGSDEVHQRLYLAEGGHATFEAVQPADGLVNGS